MPTSKKNTVVQHWETFAHNPQDYLGPHQLDNGETIVRVFSPQSESVELQLSSALSPMQRDGKTDYFIWRGQSAELEKHYTLNVTFNDKHTHRCIDPYSFTAILSDYDLHHHSEGNHWHIYNHLGANKTTIDDVEGVSFAVWAPNAQRVSVVGNFNSWDGRRHTMQKREGYGVWELFIPKLAEGEIYKFEVLNSQGNLVEKIDPYGKQFELRPNTAAIVNTGSHYQWQDQQWLEQRKNQDWLHAPVSVYEVHLGSWKRDDNHHFMNYRELAHELAKYVVEAGFTHVELLPITEHPFDGSWGYQTLGYFAPTSRFGTPDDFRYFVDHLHQNNIGIILDWVPAHFPTDSHGLARYDGTALYEHDDPRKGEHRDWGTYIYNYGRNEVKNFLISSALFWIEEFHLDGLRVDAVASMLYLDYSREANDWVPNEHGGNENYEAIAFLKHLTSVTQQQNPGCLLIAEESTAWPAVSRPTYDNGLGFSMKWNMGWMHDTLSFCEKEPIHRKHHHNNLSFGMMYAFTENFMLPFSHDEVVHGKKSMLDKMSGDTWQKFANLRLLYTYMLTYPGKKLLFMGSEFGQWSEWNEAAELDWKLTTETQHQGLLKLLSTLNQLYKENACLHFHDFEGEGFQWINCEDSQNSVLSYLRKHNGQQFLIVLNFTPVPRDNYRLGVPNAGRYIECFNSDSHFYAGSNFHTQLEVATSEQPYREFGHSITLDLPPLGGLIYRFCE